MARNDYGNGFSDERVADLAERIRRRIGLGTAGGGKGSRTLLSTKARDKDSSDNIAALAERIRQRIASEAVDTESGVGGSRTLSCRISGLELERWNSWVAVNQVLEKWGRS